MLVCVDQCYRQLLEQQKLLDSSLDVICAIDAEGRFLQVTAAAQKLWGYHPEELRGRHCMDMVVPEDHALTETIGKAVLAGTEITNFQNRYRRKDGSVVPVLWSARWDEEAQIAYCVARDASEKAEVEKKAKASEEKLFRAYKLARIGWWEWDQKTRELSVSDEFYEIFGLDRGNTPSVTIDLYFSLVHPEDLPGVKEAMRLCREQTYHQFDHRVVRPSGEINYIIHYTETIRDAEGNLVQVHGTTKNITQRKTAEVALKQSEHRLLRILESIDDGFFTVDKDWTVTYWNQKAEEVLQRKREDILGKNLWEVYANAIPLKFYTEYHRAFQENRKVQFEEFFPPLHMWLEVSAYPSQEGLSVFFKNITRRKLQEEEIRENNRRYGYVTKATSDAIWDWDLVTGTVHWGEGAATNFGHDLAKLRSDINSWSKHVHPDDVARVRKSLDQLIEGSESKWRDEYRYRKADGTYAFVLDKGFVIRNEQGKAIRMVGAMQDISRQKEAELSIKLSEEQFRLLFYLSPKPKWMFRAADWQIIEVNQAAIELYGYAKDEFLGLTIPDLKLEADLPELDVLHNAQFEQYHNIVRHVKKSGEVFFTDLSIHAIDLPTGRHFIVTGDDMTEKLRLQQELIEEKITAQKEVAKAILDTQERERSEIGKELHDNVNQLLTTAKLYIENIRYFPQQAGEFVTKGVSLLQRSIDEIRSLSKQLVTPVMNDIGFEATIEELISHYQSLRLFDIEVHYAICEEALDKGLKLTIYRIIQEQLNNIVKYAQASLVTVAVLYGEDGIRVTVCDNGIGFDVARTSKGLGLKNMKNRAEVYKGTVEIQTAPGKGSSITVSFPVLEPVAV